MKKIIIGMMLVFILLGTMNVVQADEIYMLDYEDSRYIILDGNVTLSFESSDTGNDDLSIFRIMYDLSENKTLYQITSNTIQFDCSFVNDTKNYIYSDNSSKLYNIFVDYSSISVQAPLSDTLNDTIEQLNIQISNLETNITVLEQIILDKNTTINDFVQATFDTAYLRREIDNITLDRNVIQYQLNETILSAGNTISKNNARISELENVWYIGHLNYTSFIFGLLFVVFIVMLINKKARDTTFSTIQSVITSKKGKARQRATGVDKSIKEYEKEYMEEGEK